MSKLGVRAVINMCDEYKGPVEAYSRLGIRQLWLPTVDHFEPSLESMKDAVRFIQECKERKERVYVHCKAGHGRGAAIALCWMISQRPGKSVSCTISSNAGTRIVCDTYLICCICLPRCRRWS